MKLITAFDAAVKPSELNTLTISVARNWAERAVARSPFKRTHQPLIKRGGKVVRPADRPGDTEAKPSQKGLVEAEENVEGPAVGGDAALKVDQVVMREFQAAEIGDATSRWCRNSATGRRTLVMHGI